MISQIAVELWVRTYSRGADVGLAGPDVTPEKPEEVAIGIAIMC